jgi:hypothetical protein
MSEPASVVASPWSAVLRIALGPVAPPSVSVLMDPGNGRAEFVRIAREVFPDRAEELLGAAAPGLTREAARMRLLSSLVEERYLPLGRLERYGDVADGVPIPRLGPTDYEYHQVEAHRPGALLLRALIEDPYMELDTAYLEELTEEERGEYGGIRVTVLELCEEYVPRELLEPLERSGLSPEQLHERLDGTAWEAAAWYADYLAKTTGCVCYDTSAEDDDPDPPWSAEVLGELAEQWRRSQRWEEELGRLFERLEEDPPARFGELLRAVFDGGRGRRKGRGGRQMVHPPRTLAEVLAAPAEEP